MKNDLKFIPQLEADNVSSYGFLLKMVGINTVQNAEKYKQGNDPTLTIKSYMSNDDDFGESTVLDFVCNWGLPQKYLEDFKENALKKGYRSPIHTGKDGEKKEGTGYGLYALSEFSEKMGLRLELDATDDSFVTRLVIPKKSKKRITKKIKNELKEFSSGMMRHDFGNSFGTIYSSSEMIPLFLGDSCSDDIRNYCEKFMTVSSKFNKDYADIISKQYENVDLLDSTILSIGHDVDLLEKEYSKFKNILKDEKDERVHNRIKNIRHCLDRTKECINIFYGISEKIDDLKKTKINLKSYIRHISFSE